MTNYFSNSNVNILCFFNLRRLIQNDEETTLCKKVHTAPIKETTCMPATETTPTAGVTPTTVRKLKRPRQSEVAIDSKIRNENDAYS